MDMITRSKFLLRLDLGQPQDPGKDRVLVRVERRVCWFTEQPEDRHQTLLLPTLWPWPRKQDSCAGSGLPALGSGLTPALGCRGASSGVPGPVRLLPPDMRWQHLWALCPYTHPGPTWAPGGRTPADSTTAAQNRSDRNWGLEEV